METTNWLQLRSTQPSICTRANGQNRRRGWQNQSIQEKRTDCRQKNAFWPWIRCRWNVHWHWRQGRPKSQPIVIDLGKDRHDDHAATDTPKNFDESLILFNNFRDEDHYNIWRLWSIKSSPTGGDLNTVFSTLRADPTCTSSLNPARRKSIRRRLSHVVAHSWIVMLVPHPQAPVDHFVVTLPSFLAFFLHIIWITLWHRFSRPTFTHAVHHHAHITRPFFAAMRLNTRLGVGQRTKQSKASNPKTCFHSNKQDKFFDLLTVGSDIHIIGLIDPWHLTHLRD